MKRNVSEVGLVVMPPDVATAGTILFKFPTIVRITLDARIDGDPDACGFVGG